MAWYKTGTISVTASGTTATGTGTAFLSNVRIGDALVIDGSAAQYEVINVVSDTVLSFFPAYSGTAGGGRSYAIVPILGYDKDLSDAFNAIRLQWGASLAALKPWATSPTTDAALTALEFSDTGKVLVKVADQAGGRAALGLGTAAQRNAIGAGDLFARGGILGTVSQSGGVPTGAIIQSGSNVNGWFVRYADGTQECCTTTQIRPPAGGALTFVWPAAFLAGSEVVALASVVPSGGWEIASGWYGSSSTGYVQFNGALATGNPVKMFAIGRWF